jgi:uncharacterized repeat protein (TIGR03803 family)
MCLGSFRVRADVTVDCLYSFTGGNDGGQPMGAGLLLGADGNFYGMTSFGGPYVSQDPYSLGYGTIFKVTTNGTLTTLYSFAGTNDGAYPFSKLVQGTDGNFYGLASFGGPFINTDPNGLGYGTVFKLTTNGLLTVLYCFTGGSDGAYPGAGLVQGADGNFYGTTVYGGPFTNQDSVGVGYGTIFKIMTNGTLKTLYSFTGGANGANPNGALVQGRDGNFYGTTVNGGPFTNRGPVAFGSIIGVGYGTVFKLTPAGALTTLGFFSGTNGANPFAALTPATDGNFYGTAVFGGPHTNESDYVSIPVGYGSLDGIGYGAVFKITTNGILTTLHTFDNTPDATPLGGVVQDSDGSFYGTTEFGTLFKMRPDGSLTTLYDLFMLDFPYAPLTLGSDGNFYGTTAGIMDNGCIFRLSGFAGSSDLTITTASPLPGGMVGIAYGQTLAVTGGTSPYFWSLASGSLPAGLILNPNGAISGIPTTVTNTSFTVEVSDNNDLSTTKTLSLTINSLGAQLVTKIAAGGVHSLFLKSDGSLWAMGDNEAGQLGDGSTNNAYSPEQIVASGVTAIAGGFEHSLFLKSDGSLWAMGNNEAGQLGDGSTNNAYKPEQIVAGGVNAVAAGVLHSLFIRIFREFRCYQSGGI